MNTRSKTVSTESGKVKITLTAQLGIAATISTDQLLMKSLNQADENIAHNYRWLLGNPQNIKLIRDGKPWEKEIVHEFINSHTNLWNSGNPFSVFYICDKQTNSFFGSLNIYFRESKFADNYVENNIVELGFFIAKEDWNKKYELEIAAAGLEYLKFLYALPQQTLKEKPKAIIASMHPENDAGIDALTCVLKNKTNSVFTKYKDQPRNLFFFSLEGEAKKSKLAPAKPAQVDISAGGTFYVRGYKITNPP